MTVIQSGICAFIDIHTKASFVLVTDSTHTTVSPSVVNTIRVRGTVVKSFDTFIYIPTIPVFFKDCDISEARKTLTIIGTICISADGIIWLTIIQGRIQALVNIGHRQAQLRCTMNRNFIVIERPDDGIHSGFIKISFDFELES